MKFLLQKGDWKPNLCIHLHTFVDDYIVNKHFMTPRSFHLIYILRISIGERIPNSNR